MKSYMVCSWWSCWSYFSNNTYTAIMKKISKEVLGVGRRFWLLSVGVSSVKMSMWLKSVEVPKALKSFFFSCKLFTSCRAKENFSQIVNFSYLSELSFFGKCFPHNGFFFFPDCFPQIFHFIPILLSLISLWLILCNWWHLLDISYIL